MPLEGTILLLFQPFMLSSLTLQPNRKVASVSEKWGADDRLIVRIKTISSDIHLDLRSRTLKSCHLASGLGRCIERTPPTPKAPLASFHPLLLFTSSGRRPSSQILALLIF